MLIYRAISPSGKSYIGVTKDLKARKYEHERKARNGMRREFYSAIRKYGFNSFRWQVLFWTPTENLGYMMEEFFIWLFGSYKNGYNMIKGGRCIKGYTGERIIKNHEPPMPVGYKRTRDSIYKQLDSANKPWLATYGPDGKRIGIYRTRAELSEDMGVIRHNINRMIQKGWMEKDGFFIVTNKKRRFKKKVTPPPYNLGIKIRPLKNFAVSKDDERVGIFKNVAKFARENNLDYKCIISAIKTGHKHRGYTFKYV